MIHVGALIDARNYMLRVIPTPDYIAVTRGEVVARSMVTGTLYIAKVNPVGFSGRPDIARVALFTVTTEANRWHGGRPTITGGRGKMVIGTARTNIANVIR